MSATTVFIAGLTGKFARLLAGHLLAKPNVRITGTARSPSKLPSELSSNPRVEVFQADADNVTTIRKALKGSSVAICCYLGDHNLMREGQKKLIDAAIAEGIPRYIAGDWCIDYRNIKYGEAPMKDPMKQVTEYLEEKQDQIKGVHVLNGEFMETLFSFSALYDVESNTFNHWGSGNEKLDLTTYDDAAKYTAEVALDSHANGFIEGQLRSFLASLGCLMMWLVLGDSISVQDIAATFKEIYGTEAKVQRLGSLEDLYNKLIETRKAQPHNPFAWMSL